jgi:hypothetical protein
MVILKPQARHGRIEVNHPISIPSQYHSNAPVINRGQLPAVVVRSLPDLPDSSRTNPKRVCISDSSTQQCLKPLDRYSDASLSLNVTDLDYFRSIFLFPLDYLRGNLMNAYRWAQELLAPEERLSPKFDTYV